MASLQTRIGKPRPYVVRWRDPSGKPKSKSFRLKKDALTRKREVEHQLDTGSYRDPKAGRIALTALWQQLVGEAEQSGRPSPRTMTKYADTWKLYVSPALGDRMLFSITRRDARQLVSTAMERSGPWQAAEAGKLLRVLLYRAMDAERISVNVAARLGLPDPRREEPTALTPAEIARLADAIGDEWRALVLLGAYGSLRFSELAGLTVADLDLPRRRVVVSRALVEIQGRPTWSTPKTTKSRRAVSIPEFVAMELAERVRKFPPPTSGPYAGLVFGVDDGPLTRARFYRVWRPATRAAGVPGFRAAWLRHTGTSLAIAAGATKNALADRLGHTTTRMIDRHYAVAFEGIDREIADRLERMAENAEAEHHRLRGAGA